MVMPSLGTSCSLSMSNYLDGKSTMFVTRGETGWRRGEGETTRPDNGGAEERLGGDWGCGSVSLKYRRRCCISGINAFLSRKSKRHPTHVASRKAV
jgi:hypothetical protein